MMISCAQMKGMNSMDLGENTIEIAPANMRVETEGFITDSRVTGPFLLADLEQAIMDYETDGEKKQSEGLIYFVVGIKMGSTNLNDVTLQLSIVSSQSPEQGGVLLANVKKAVADAQTSQVFGPVSILFKQTVPKGPIGGNR
jgi:hypothetical protein